MEFTYVEAIEMQHTNTEYKFYKWYKLFTTLLQGGKCCNSMVFIRLLPSCTQPCTEQGVNKVEISIWEWYCIRNIELSIGKNY